METFAALATVPGESALAVVRVCGPLAPHVLEAALKGSTSATNERFARFGRYRALDGELVDEVVFTWFPARASFTGRDTLEISLHGNPLLYQKILEDLRVRGCRPAQPGEFTRTAFLEGKIDLSQAEAVADLIAARSDAAIEAAQKQLSGGLGAEIDEMVNAILSLLAQIEAYIDFPEEDLPDENHEGPLRSLHKILQQLKDMISTGPMRELLHRGIRTIILGEVNVGKSSLLNRLLGTKRAIVNALPGTTRDFIEDTLQVGKYCIRITDTAGWREDATGIEKEGIDRMIEQIKAADFCLLVLDGTADSPTLPPQILNQLSPSHCLVVTNKMDCAGARECKDFFPDYTHVAISASEGIGMDTLLAQWENLLSKELLAQAEERILYNQRHIGFLSQCQEHLLQAKEAMSSGISSECVTTDIREAIDALSAIVGKIDNEEMLDVLFGAFCIGK